jgi:hypothetical protein
MKIDRAQKAMKAVLKTNPWEGECLKNWLEQFDGLEQTKMKSHAGSRRANNVFVKRTASHRWRHRNQLSFLSKQMETQKTLWVQEESQIGSRRQTTEQNGPTPQESKQAIMAQVNTRYSIYE